MRSYYFILFEHIECVLVFFLVQTHSLYLSIMFLGIQFKSGGLISIGMFECVLVWLSKYALWGLPNGPTQLCDSDWFLPYGCRIPIYRVLRRLLRKRAPIRAAATIHGPADFVAFTVCFFTGFGLLLFPKPGFSFFCWSSSV